MRALFVALVVLAAAPALADRASYQRELARRAANRSAMAASKREAYLRKRAKSSSSAQRRLDAIARQQRYAHLTYQGPKCHSSRAGRIAAQRAYLRVSSRHVKQHSQLNANRSVHAKQVPSQ